MLNRGVLFICFGMIVLSVVSCSYASNETDILNDTVNTVCINVPSVDLESDYSDKDSFDDVNSDIDNISIYYGELVEIVWDDDMHCNSSVFIDNKFVNFISDLSSGGVINMYNYDFDHHHEDFLNSIYPNVGLHNIFIIFEFDTPQKYDVTIEKYKDGFFDGRCNDNVLRFQFNDNEDSEAKKRFLYNTTLNILKKDKTVHITNISPVATYIHSLYFDVIADNPGDAFRIFISNETGFIIFDSFSSGSNLYGFDGLMHKIKPGVYNFTVVSYYDSTFDTASFIFYNNLIINTTYRIIDNDVILNVELWCEYNTSIRFCLFKLINETPYDYRVITKEILANDNDHKFNFEICFNDVDNNDYYMYISDYDSYNYLDCFYFTVNYTFVYETKIIDDVNDTVNVSDNVEGNVPDGYNSSNAVGNGNSSNLDLKGNITNHNSYQSHKSNVWDDDFRAVISDFGDLVSSVDSISSENANSYELIEKSTSKSASNIFSNLGIVILLFTAFIVGFLYFKREY